MAAVTLPSNPTNGQTFEVGSTTYTYNSTLGVWDSESPATIPDSESFHPFLLSGM